MIHVKIGEAATSLAQILDQALQGEEVVIEREDGGAVRMVAVRQAAAPEPEFSNEALASMDDCELNHYLC